MNERAQQLAQGLARELLARVRRQAPESRQRALRLKLDQSTAPLLYETTPEEARQAWAGIRYLIDQGAVAITFNPRKPATEHQMWRDPVLSVNTEHVAALARCAGIALGPSYEVQVLAALAHEPRVSEAGRAALQGMRFKSFEGFPPADLAHRFAKLVELAREEPTLFLREASARVFDGLSKLLDGRSDLVSALLGGACPWLETPIPILVSGPQPTGLLHACVFVENLTTFERLSCLRAQYPGTVFLYASGYKSAAARAARAPGRRLFGDASLSDSVRTAIEAALEAPSGKVTVAFYGDLDFAGMDILASLRQPFPAVTAWQVGYAALKRLLEAGRSHAPQQADKEGQVDPGMTGCVYADTVLLPVLREHGRFVDQESILQP